MVFSFLAIAFLGGASLLGAGQNLGLQGRTTSGLVLGLIGVLILIMAYGSGQHWGIFR